MPFPSTNMSGSASVPSSTAATAKKHDAVSLWATVTSPFRGMMGRFLAGAAAGLCADMAVHPIDTIRTRLVVQNVNEVIASGSGMHATAAASLETPYRGTWEGFRRIVAFEGWKSLYRGSGIVIAMTTPGHALYFGGYELTKRILSPSDGSEVPWVHFVSGMSAEVCGGLLWCPMEVIKQRIQIKRTALGGSAPTTLATCRDVLAESGVRGFFRGFFATCVTFAPFSAVYFLCYEFVKTTSSLVLGNDREDIPLSVSLIGGLAAGSVAAAATVPLDVIKTRIQVQPGNVSAEERYKHMWDCATRLWKAEGPRAFVQGVTARMLWIAPNAALGIMAYEAFKRVLRAWGMQLDQNDDY